MNYLFAADCYRRSLFRWERVCVVRKQDPATPTHCTPTVTVLKPQQEDPLEKCLSSFLLLHSSHPGTDEANTHTTSGSVFHSSCAPHSRSVPCLTLPMQCILWAQEIPSSSLGSATAQTTSTSQRHSHPASPAAKCAHSPGHSYTSRMKRSEEQTKLIQTEVLLAVVCILW